MSEAIPDPKVFYPHFVVHQHGKPVVLSVDYLAIVSPITEEDASKVPQWAKTEIHVGGKCVFCDESVNDVCQRLLPES